MNCQPGDLCRVISTQDTRDLGIVDRFVVVTDLNPQTSALVGEPCWNYRGDLVVEKGFFPFFTRGPLASIEDSILRPIRDPGTDVVSQDVQPLPMDAERVALAAASHHLARRRG